MNRAICESYPREMARADGKPENQHYVPQMLLRNFAFPGIGRIPQIYVFDKTAERSFKTGIVNIAAERGFYEFKIGSYTVSAEEGLSALEAGTGSAFSRLLTERTLQCLSDEDMDWIAVFMAAQHLRSKGLRESLRDLQDQMADHLRGMGADPSDVEGFKVYDDDELKRFGVEFLSETTPLIANLIRKKFWLLFETTSDHPFWISDNPVVLYNSTDHRPYGNVGFSVPGIEIYLPLSPTLMLGTWCATIEHQFVETWRQVKRTYSQAVGLSVFGGLVHNSEQRNHLATMKRELDRKEPAVAAMTEGRPLPCSPENVTFFNSLQVKWAERYLMSSSNGFRLARDMLKNSGRAKQGMRMSMG